MLKASLKRPIVLFAVMTLNSVKVESTIDTMWTYVSSGLHKALVHKAQYVSYIPIWTSNRWPLLRRDKKEKSRAQRRTKIRTHV